jgi:hypothetical protein
MLLIDVHAAAGTLADSYACGAALLPSRAGRSERC